MIKSGHVRFPRRIPPFFLHPTGAVNLAVFRIVIFSAVLIESAMPGYNCVWFAGLPANLQSIPWGLHYIMEPVEIPLFMFKLVYAVFCSACVFSILGFAGRVFVPLATLLATICLGVPHLYGAFNSTGPHNQHLVWFATILACSPCCDALAISRVKDNRTQSVSVRYGMPLRFVWILLGVIYFFPGIYKLSHWGVGRRSGEVLKRILSQRFEELSGLYTFDADLIPVWFLAAVAFLVIAFQISFIFLLFSKKMRGRAIAMGVVFHLSTFAIMRISFWHLLVCYVAFCNFRGSRSSCSGIASEKAPGQLLTACGVVLISVSMLCGIFNINSWPFSIYPTFARYSAADIVKLDLIDFEFYNADGRSLPWQRRELFRNFGRHRWKLMLERIVHESDSAAQREQLSSLVAVIVANDEGLREVNAVRVYSGVESLKPMGVIIRNSDQFIWAEPPPALAPDPIA